MLRLIWNQHNNLCKMNVNSNKIQIKTLWIIIITNFRIRIRIRNVSKVQMESINQSKFFKKME